MRIGRVVATVVAPIKHAGLGGSKLLVVAFDDGTRTVAVDDLGAGEDSCVLVATGSHAVQVVRPDSPADAVIVGLLDD